jgi:hypothetical protein
MREKFENEGEKFVWHFVDSVFWGSVLQMS